MAADTTRAALLLVQFAREPREGQVKTRLIPALGASGACALHCELTLWTCRQLLGSRLGPVELSVAGDTAHTLFAHCIAEGVDTVSEQYGEDLGRRMYHALQRGLQHFEAVILVGSDCPGITPDYLALAADALRRTAVVLGPATDGGYVLIGARQVADSVFNDIPWGGNQVYARTVAALDVVGLSWTALPALTDIDRPADLAVWEAIKRGTAIPEPAPSRFLSPETASRT